MVRERIRNTVSGWLMLPVLLGVIGVAIWYALAILYFAVRGRKTLVMSPEEEFAVRQRGGGAS